MKLRNSKTNFKRGQAIMIASIFFLIISVTVISSIVIPVSKQVKIISDLSKTRSSFFLAEGGIEDVVYRFVKGYEVSDSEEFELDGYTATIEVAESPQGKIITVEGNVDDYFRKIEVELSGGEGTAFSYGAQVGDGGLHMQNTSKVIGNVFSTGDIEIDNSARITGSAIVAGEGGIIEDALVEGDASADICDHSMVLGTLYTNSNIGCSYGELVTLGDPLEPIPLPITQEKIDEWKAEAAAGQIISGDYDISDDTFTLGPAKILGDMVVQNGAELILTGVLWVTGDIDIKNNDTKVRLDSSFGGASSVIISDSDITLQNDSVSSGSGTAGSYLMYLSTSTADPAIEIKNSAKVDILYTSAGRIDIGNSTKLKTIIGYGVDLSNSAEIKFESGLLNTFFTTGQGEGNGAFGVSSWREIE